MFKIPMGLIKGGMARASMAGHNVMAAMASILSMAESQHRFSWYGGDGKRDWSKGAENSIAKENRWNHQPHEHKRVIARHKRAQERIAANRAARGGYSRSGKTKYAA